MFRKTLFVLLGLVTIPAYANDMLEPWINGDVSASDTFPSQEMEEQILAYLDWRSAEPYYLFQVAAQKISDPYPEN